MSDPARPITVLYFAEAYTATKLFSESIPIPEDQRAHGLLLSDLSRLLIARHAASNLEDILRTSMWSVNAEMVDDEDIDKTLLRGGEEVAVICPVSGG